MEIEYKLDQDFLFYLNFTNTFLKRITDSDTFRHSKFWVYKLCTEPCETVERKRCRNMYLANLLICMQNGKLEEPYTKSPNHVDISDAMDVFSEAPETAAIPAWLNDTEYDQDACACSSTGREKKGRTYFATRTLPHGQGAFAYIGISLTGDDWLDQGGGDVSLERRQALERRLEQRFQEEVPAEHEMERILAKRKDPREREKVLAFYDVLLQAIGDELEGKELSAQNETVEGLLGQLVDDLKDKGAFQDYEQLDEYARRMELQVLLYDRVKSRRDKVAKREEYLDDIEQRIMPKSFFETSVEPEDKYELPSAMWQQAINKLPSKKQMESLQEVYPLAVIEKFVKLLALFKEEIAERMHRRHESIVTQMKKELRKEGAKTKKEAERLEAMCYETEEVYNAVKEHYKKKMAAEDANKNQFEVQLSDHSRAYEEMRAAVLDTQKLVEEEALRGKFLADQINAVSEQSELIHQVNEDSIRHTEEANIKILRNIKRMNIAIKTYEARLNDFQNMSEQTKKNAQSLMIF